MRTLKRIRYYTMNSWNRSTAPAYNLKVHRVINDQDLQDRIFELMDGENFYDEINELIREFDYQFRHKWQAGFNGRSGGYLVLYKGGKHEDGRPFSYPGRGTEEGEAPGEVLRAFRKLAIDIVKNVEYMAKNAEIKDVPYTVMKKVINY
jgi:hypothetical protein